MMVSPFAQSGQGVVRHLLSRRTETGNGEFKSHVLLAELGQLMPIPGTSAAESDMDGDTVRPLCRNGCDVSFALSWSSAHFQHWFADKTEKPSCINRINTRIADIFYRRDLGSMPTV
jgi:hypothetical protein